MVEGKVFVTIIEKANTKKLAQFMINSFFTATALSAAVERICLWLGTFEN